MNNQTQKASPRDVFMHIFGIALLYAVVANFLVLVFQYVDHAFPDVLNPYYDAGETIRWSLAMIIIIFPVFLWVSRFINKDLKENPWKSEIKIRRWLLYFTLFAAAILIMGDLVALIYNFLQGELTLRFILKVLAVLIMAAGVFGYYFYDLRRKPYEFLSWAKYFVWSVIAIVIVIIVYGFFVAGSPFEARLIRFDEQKVSNLQDIQGHIVNFWIQKQKLPVSLDELIDTISGFVPPKDPQDGSNYIYNKTGGLSFELCAKFNLKAPPYEKNQAGPLPAYPFRANETWSHPAGEYCFPRVIDPELYKPVKSAP